MTKSSKPKKKQEARAKTKTQQNQPKSKEEKGNDLWKFAKGLVLFVVFVSGIRWTILLGFTQDIFPQFFQGWVSKNLESDIAVWCIAILISGGVHFAIQLDAKVKLFGLEIGQSPFDDRYVIVIFATAVLGLLLYAKPACERSIVYIKVESLNVHSGQIYKVENNIADSLAFSANAGESELTCEWSFSGNLVKRLSTKTSCNTLASLSSNKGHSVVSVRSSEKYCPGDFSITSFEVER